MNKISSRIYSLNEKVKLKKSCVRTFDSKVLNDPLNGKEIFYRQRKYINAVNAVNALLESFY